MLATATDSKAINIFTACRSIQNTANATTILTNSLCFCLLLLKSYVTL